MKFKKTLAAATALSTLALAGGAHALVVTQDNDGTTLANTILGSGITITGTNVIGASGAFGTFTGGNASGLGIDSGIILSTGSVTDAPGPNSSDSITTNFGTAGYAPLDAATGTTSQDAAVFEITFESTGGDLFFNYIFASDEYNEFVNSSFNDAFALLVDGVNVALLGDGVTPVTINNVNGITTPGLFNNNDPSDGGPFFDLEYDGFTNSFTASAFGLSAGTHTLAFAIGDVGDGSWDSAVFIQAGSLSDTDPNVPGVPEPTSLALLALGSLAAGLAGRRRRRS